MNMSPFKKLYLLQSLLLFHVMLGSSISTQTPFINSNSSLPSLLSRIILCKSQNLYFRTSLGLFKVSSVDYNGRLLTITHSSCSSLHYLSPLAVTAGFPSPEPKSLILFNCSNKSDSISPFTQNCKSLYKCGSDSSSSSRIQEQERYWYSCLVVKDLQKVDKGFHPEQLNCSYYSWVYRSSSDGGHSEKYKMGTRISFDIPVPDICKGCPKPNGNCSAGLKCLCHAKECKDKVISKAGSVQSTGSVFFSLLTFIGFLVALIMHF